MRTGGGKTFVGLYYRLSPPVADVIAQSSILRWVTRTIGIKPMAFFAAKINRVREQQQ
jgi:hypothetical protein